jgi:leader peptidase (prepilin peptidase)/N-methyltransferase
MITLMYYIFIFIIGLLIGSFLNVCIYRIPNEESIVKPASHCGSCGVFLKPIDLIPVFSYIFLKGKCRKCGTKFSPRYLFIELLTAIVFSVLFYKYSMSIDFVAAAFLMSVLIAVFFIDLDHKIIPNGLVLTGLVGGVLIFVYNIFYPVAIYNDSNWWNPLLGSVTGSGFLFLVAIVGSLIYKSDESMGMGDVKIFIPIGIFLGWKMCIIALLLSFFIGAISSIIMMIIGTKNRKSTVSFGPSIVTGTFITFVWGWDILNWYIGYIT